jgi:uncharacterized protein
MAEIAHLLRSEKKVQLRLSFLTAVLFFAAAFALMLFNRNALLPYLFGFFFGFTLQRSRFCFAACFRDVFIIRNTTLTRAVLLAVALTTVGFVIINYLPGQPVSLELSGKVYPVGLHTVFGGVLFGFGMVIAGSCVSGCLVRMGEGYIMQWYTFAGLLTGLAIGAWNLQWWLGISIGKSSAVFLPRALGWPLALTLHFSLLGALYLLAARIGGDKKKSRGENRLDLKGAIIAKKWSYTTGAVMLALGNTLLFKMWGEPWNITSGITNFSGWLGCLAGLSPNSWAYFNLRESCSSGIFLSHPILYLALAMVVGALFSSFVNSEFRWRRPKSSRYIVSALLGGLLMGYSSRIVLGCNIGAFLTGTSSLSLHGWVFGLSLLPGAALGGKVLINYIME